METLLCLHKRVSERWRVIVSHYEDPMEFMRNRSMRTLSATNAQSEYICWISKCSSGRGFFYREKLANRIHFPRTTCVECAAESEYWKKNCVEDPDDCIAKVREEYPEGCVSIWKAETNIYEFPPSRDDSYEDGDDEDDYDHPQGIYYDVRMLESEMKKRKIYN